MTIARIGLRSTAIALFTAGAMQITGTASAHSPADPAAVGDIGKLAAASNMVFHGKVKAVTYKMSDAAAGGGKIPYTFVTYAIGNVLMGSPKSEVTLRFVGGADGQGGFLSVEGVPAFSAGDEDILFVSSNGEKGCALAQCEFGRYRVLGGAVYEAHGSPVKSIGGARMTSGGEGPEELSTISYPAPAFDDIIKNPSAAARIKSLGMTMEQARARYNAEAPKTVTMTTRPQGQTVKSKLAKGLPLATVMSTIKSAISAAPRRQAKGIADANPAARIAAPGIVPAAPGN